MAEYKELELDEHIEMIRNSLKEHSYDFFHWCLHLDILEYLQEEIEKINNLEELEETKRKIINVRGVIKEYIKISIKLRSGLKRVIWNIKLKKAMLRYRKKGENNE